MGERQGDGATLLQHLQRVATNTNKVDERLLRREPAEGRALIHAWRHMSACRRSGMAAQPITLTDMLAWCQLQGVWLTPWEVDTLIEMDAAALAALSSMTPPPSSPTTH